jgi:ATP-binding cassette, subfamily G (WHITE), member 2, SNQ2
MGFGQGADGVGGNFFQLLVVIFVELFGVSLGQVVGALSPSIRVSIFQLLLSCC